MSSDRVLDRLHIQEETKPKLELGASVITDDGVAVMARLRQENIFGRAGLGLLSYRYSDRNANLQGLLDQANGSGWLGLRTRLLWQRERPGVYENGVEVDQFAMRRTQVGLDLAVRDFRHGWSLYLGGDMGQTNSYLESRRVAGSGDQSLRTMHLTLESHGRELPLAQSNRGFRIRHVRSFDQADDEPSWWRTDLGIVMPVGGLGDWTPVWALGAVASSSDIPVVHQGRAGGPRGWIVLWGLCGWGLLWLKIGLGMCICRLGISSDFGPVVENSCKIT